MYQSLCLLVWIYYSYNFLANTMFTLTDSDPDTNTDVSDYGF